MRRRYLLLLLVPFVALLALGALPGLIGGGDVVYVTATEVDLEGGEAPTEGATDTIDAENLSENRFPYTMAALDSGVSESHEAGRFGFEDSFTHTPDDEFQEFETWNREAVADGGAVYLEHDGSYYRLEITPASDVES